jgi:hypothetical protein
MKAQSAWQGFRTANAAECHRPKTLKGGTGGMIDGGAGRCVPQALADRLQTLNAFIDLFRFRDEYGAIDRDCAVRPDHLANLCKRQAGRATKAITDSRSMTSGAKSLRRPRRPSDSISPMSS